MEGPPVPRLVNAEMDAPVNAAAVPLARPVSVALTQYKNPTPDCGAMVYQLGGVGSTPDAVKQVPSPLNV